MGVFRQFPYSNFHEMNMDEIIKIVKNMLEEWAQYYAEWDAWKNQINNDWSNYQEVMNTAWQNMQNFINNYFDNLDVQDEINNVIRTMVHSGDFSRIVEPYIPPSVSTWLAEHITTPETVIIDTSLTIEGACADAKATGDTIKNAVIDLKSFLAFEHLNLFDDSNLNADKMIDPITGTMDTVSDWSSTNFIKIDGINKIMIMIRVYNQYSHYAFYDSEKTFISGGSALSRKEIEGIGGVYTDNEIDVPNNAFYIRVCCLTSLADGYMLVDKANYYPDMEYFSYAILIAKNEIIKDSAIDAGKINGLSTAIEHEIPFKKINLFDKNNLIANHMVTPTTGTIDPVADWSSSHYINISGIETLVIMLNEYNHYSYYAFYGADGTYISGGSALSSNGNVYADVPVAVPLGAIYIRVCCETSLAYKYMLINNVNYSNGMAYIAYDEFILDNNQLADKSIDASKINETLNGRVLNVGPGQDYTTLESALGVANADPSHKYLINIYEGTYDVFANVTPPENYIGYNVANLTLRGIGNKDNIIIYGYMSDDISSTARDKVSIFNIKGNFKCENLTISAKNIRYTIHDDYPEVSNCVVEYVDCVLKGEAMTHNNVYGCGLWNGTTYKFTRCKLIGKTNTFCWGFHTIADSTQAVTPAHTIFEDCTFETDNNYFSTFNSNHTEYRDSITFMGCRFCGSIYPTGAQNMIDIYGSGNSDLMVRDGTTAKDCIVKFGDTTVCLSNKNGSTLSKGTVVKQSGWNGFDICGTSEYPLGILLEDTTSGGFGTIQTKSVLPNTLIECSAGQKISNNNGTLEISSNNIIGVCIMTNLIKLTI